MPSFKHFNADLHGKVYKVDHVHWRILQEVKKEIWSDGSGKYMGAETREQMKIEVGTYVDFDSLTSYASEMVDSLTDSLKLSDPPSEIRAMLVTLVATGFISGAKFQERTSNHE